MSDCKQGLAYPYGHPITAIGGGASDLLAGLRSEVARDTHCALEKAQTADVGEAHVRVSVVRGDKLL
jgi:hypothetical protein